MATRQTVYVAGANRLMPAMPAAAYKSYELLQPLDTHWRDATCAEVECHGHLNGWTTTCDETSVLGQNQAAYIRTEAGRSFTETRDEYGMTVFAFPAGQRCFRPHKAPLEREPFYVVRGGDFRGNPRGERAVHDSSENWVDDFANHQQGLADRLDQG